MRPLTSSELLTVWERGMNQSLLQKTLALLQMASPEMEAQDVASLSIGKRDLNLFTLREWIFGSLLRNMADCPKCSEQVEWEMQLEELSLLPEKYPDGTNEYSLVVDGYNIHFRLPNSNDISDVVTIDPKDPDPKRLLRNCIIKSVYNDSDIDFEELPKNVIDAIVQKIEELEPTADIRMKINCPNCSHQWESQFDIVSYLWTEIDNWAKRMLQDVYKLARAFGWSEKEILEMNPSRRSIYVEMVKA